ncbi:DUF1028 domain-containing protein [Halobaculum sp. MBLA0143]|uniref:DUF1028 domain-containing protein n=1 Tax=Halobaculum sp. MBLA0143 TaxID=3079933 RepID=UPI003523DD41
MTFSICARVPSSAHDVGDGAAYAVAVTTDAPAVGAFCPFVSSRGVVATQAFVNVRLGRRGIALLDDLAVEDALSGLLARDDHAENRQLHGVDDDGVFGFTGANTDPYSDHRLYEDAGVTVAGNILTGEATLTAAGETFLESEGRIGERLLDALAAGVEAGGDERGHTSAALLIWAPQTTPYHDLRVDEHETPVAELRRVRAAAVEASDGFSEASKHRIFD